MALKELLRNKEKIKFNLGEYFEFAGIRPQNLKVINGLSIEYEYLKYVDVFITKAGTFVKLSRLHDYLLDDLNIDDHFSYDGLSKTSETIKSISSYQSLEILDSLLAPFNEWLNSTDLSVYDKKVKEILNSYKKLDSDIEKAKRDINNGYGNKSANKLKRLLEQKNISPEEAVRNYYVSCFCNYLANKIDLLIKTRKKSYIEPSESLLNLLSEKVLAYFLALNSSLEDNPEDMEYTDLYLISINKKFNNSEHYSVSYPDHNRRMLKIEIDRSKLKKRKS